MGINKLLLVALVAHLLCAAALAYVTLPMNAKSELSLEARAHNQRRSSDNPLGGGARIGYYYVELDIGSQTFRVDIDTGSSTLYVVGPYCHYIENGEACTYASSYYQGNGTYKSCSNGCDSCQNGVCIMTATYGDGTKVYGAVTMDTLKIGSYSATAPIAVSYLQSQEYGQSTSTSTYMDGLWGMAYNGFNGGQPTVMDALVSAGMPNVFAICLSDTGGYLTLGGINTAYHTGSVSYTPITLESYYVMRINSVAVGSSTLSSGFPLLTILDSGTTYTYVPQALYNDMATALINAGMSRNYFGAGATCVVPGLTTPPDLVFTLPQVGGGTFTLTFGFSQYTSPCGSLPSYGRRFGFLVGDDDMAILGDTFMRPWNNVFDRANKQLGFATVSSSCTGNVALTSGQQTVPAKTSPFSAATSSYAPGIASLLAILAATLAIVL